MAARSRRRPTRPTYDERLERELDFHIEQHAADLMARGVSPDAARREARLALGGPEQVKEQCREVRRTRWLEDLLRDSRYATRTIRREPGFAGAIILILALGIGATTAMFAVVNGVLLRPLAYPEPDRLVSLRGFTEKTGTTWGFSKPDLDDIRAGSRTVSLAAWAYGGGTLSAPGEPEYLLGRKVSAELFQVLGVALVNGRGFEPEDDRPGGNPVAIISYGLWQRRFAGAASAIGASLTFDGRPYVVGGVLPRGFDLGGEADIFTPLGQDPDPRLQNRAARFIRLVGRLRPGVSVADTSAELATISGRLAIAHPATNEGHSIRILALQRDVVGNVGATLWFLMAAVSIVLLIACVNIASLMLARASAREREFAVRTALGAGRGRLLRQCLTESVLLSLCGGALGVAGAIAVLGPFVASWAGNLPRVGDIRIDAPVCLFALALSLGTALFFGVVPAIRMPLRVDRDLRVGGRTMTGTSNRLHGIFVVSQIALAVVLLSAAGMLGRTLLTLSSLDPGLDVSNVLTARFAISPSLVERPPAIRAAWQDALDRAARLPGVQAAALTDIVPMRPGENTLPYWTNADPIPVAQLPSALASSVTPAYPRVMGIPLRHGRFIDDHDRLGSDPVIVVDENLARHAFGRTDVVGRQLWVRAVSESPSRIVGVVGHVRHWGLGADDQSSVQDQIYYPLAQVPDQLLHFFSSIMSIAVRTAVPPQSVADSMRRELRGTNGDQSLYQFRTLEQLVSGSLAEQRLLMWLVGAFAVFALLLACVGIYGLLSYVTRTRVREFGVRMALGATAGEIRRLVLGRSATLIAAGVAVGAGGAWIASRVMMRLVEGMRPADVPTAAATIGLLVMAALIASAVPAYRASRLNVTRALRED
jgi:predicted permease